MLSDIYMFIQIDIKSVNSQQKMSKIEHYFHLSAVRNIIFGPKIRRT